MFYKDLFEATESLGRKLYKFSGHSVTATKNSWMFNELAKGLDLQKKDPAAKAICYDASVYLEGQELPATVIISGTDMFHTVECGISLKH